MVEDDGEDGVDTHKYDQSDSNIIESELILRRFQSNESH